MLRKLVALGATLGFLAMGVACKKEEKKEAQVDQKLVQLQADLKNIENLDAELQNLRDLLGKLEKINYKKVTDEELAELGDTGQRLLQAKAEGKKKLRQELEVVISELRQQVDSKAEELNTKLADFLNIALNDYPDRPETEKALRIFTREAVLLAEYNVMTAGAFSRAKESLQNVSTYWEAIGKPVPQEVTDKLLWIQDLKYANKERFKKVRKGMTKEEVTQVLGPAARGNRRMQKGYEVWIYPKREEDGGGAAAIYFKKGKVASKNWNAIKPEVKK